MPGPERDLISQDVENLIGEYLPETSERPIDVIQAARDAILSAEIQIRQLRERTHKLKAFVDSSARLLSPIQRLPPEILSEVFSICNCRRSCTMEVKTWLPWTLTYVCRSWRQVALGMPSLWAQLDHLFKSQKPELLALALERAMPLPFDLDLYLSFDRDSEKFFDRNKALVQEILKHSQRVKSLMTFLPDAALPFFTSDPEGEGRNHGSSHIVPWMKLRVLDVDTPSREGLRTMLSLGPRIQSLTLGTEFGLDVNDGAGPIVMTLSHLQTLVVGGFECLPLLVDLTLPALESFTCSFTLQEALPDVYRCILHFRCAITDLTLGFIWDSQEEMDVMQRLRQLWSVCSQLKSLDLNLTQGDISNETVIQQVFQSLVIDPLDAGNSTFLPCLEQVVLAFSFANVRSIDSVDSETVTMIESRWNRHRGVSRLEFLSVDFRSWAQETVVRAGGTMFSDRSYVLLSFPNISEGDFARLEQLKSAGMDLLINW